MQLGLWIRLAICLGVISCLLFFYMDKQNELTKLKIQIPKAQKQLKALNDEVGRLQYEIELFENPAHLMELASYPEFSHLKHPLVRDVLMIGRGMAMDDRSVEKRETISSPVNIPFGFK